VRNLISNMDKYGDLQNPKYYNILVFKEREKRSLTLSQVTFAATGAQQ
jgi:hypothetical protein